MRAAFARSAADFSTYRAGFPPILLERLHSFGLGLPGQTVVDLGTGDGSLARMFAQAGCAVTGLDPVAPLLAEARQADQSAGVAVEYRVATAEQSGLPDSSVDLVVAGQCWHWFERPQAAAEARRILRPGGALVIAHFDWIALPGNVVAASEDLIRKWNTGWAMGAGSGLYPQWLADLAMAGFTGLETFSRDEVVPYDRLAWRTRIRTSVGIAASLSPQLVADFDYEHARMLDSRFPANPLQVPHRLWAVVGWKR